MFPAGWGCGEAEKFCQAVAAAAAPGVMDGASGSEQYLYPRGGVCQASYTSSHFPRAQA